MLTSAKVGHAGIFQESQILTSLAFFTRCAICSCQVLGSNVLTSDMHPEERQHYTWPWADQFFHVGDVSLAKSDDELSSRKCLPCEDGVGLTLSESRRHLSAISGWDLLSGPDRIRKSWQMQDFNAAISFLNRVAELAESEGHHPDFHLVRYRDLSIEIWTHAVQGLSLNDFILAARIDQIPVLVRDP